MSILMGLILKDLRIWARGDQLIDTDSFLHHQLTSGFKDIHKDYFVKDALIIFTDTTGRTLTKLNKG